VDGVGLCGELGMVDELVSNGDGAPASADVEVIEAAAEQVRREVLALKVLGDRHAELKSQVRLLAAELDAVANEYRTRYRQLAGGQFMNTALRQLGMGESLAGATAGRKRRRPAAKRETAPAGVAT
jgi:hypothetical protein